MKDKNRQKNKYERLKTNDFMQNYIRQIKLDTIETFLWILYPETITEKKNCDVMIYL